MSDELLEDIWNDIKREPAFAGLRTGNNAFVPGEGASERAKAFVIGEAPGAQEAIKRRPFVGAAGKVQRQLMGFAGLRAEIYTTALAKETTPPANCWLTNVLHYRPNGNRKPTSSEIAAARQYILREWEAVGSPWLVIAVGNSALEAILGRSMSILKVSGKPLAKTSASGELVFVWPMIHPAFGLRNKAVQPIIENDWLALAEWLGRRENDRRIFTSSD